MVQVEACVDAFMNAEAFDRLPHAPPDFMAFGILAMLLSYHEGHAESTCFDKVPEPTFDFFQNHLALDCN